MEDALQEDFLYTLRFKQCEGFLLNTLHLTKQRLGAEVKGYRLFLWEMYFSKSKTFFLREQVNREWQRSVSETWHVTENLHNHFTSQFVGLHSTKAPTSRKTCGAPCWRAGTLWWHKRILANLITFWRVFSAVAIWMRNLSKYFWSRCEWFTY